VRETQFLQKVLGGKKFLNRAFVADTLAAQVASDRTHSILHLATHGEFSGAAGNSFVQAFDRRIYLPQLEAILKSARQTIQLLTLSACQTAAGDNRAVLGLAGLAARTGVENVIASLWFVDDTDIVPIVENFYTFLKTTDSVDEALRQSQLISIRNGVHPIAWSALVAVKS
jgi:CHAT domain-containing protein